MATLFYTSDVHSYFFSKSYLDGSEQNTGYFKMANYFEPSSLVINGGDLLQGSPFARQMLLDDSFEIAANILNDTKTDVFVPGNHDFNFGYEKLKRFINSFKGDVIASNVKDKTNSIKVISEKVYELDGVRIGIAGVVTDFVNIWDKGNLEPITIRDSFTSAKESLERLKAQRPDYTILVYHGGFPGVESENSGYKENRADEFVTLGYDAILTAHQHLVIEPKYVDDVLTMQTGAKGEYFARLDIAKEKKVNAKLIAVKDLPTINFDYSASYEEYNRKVIKNLSKVIGCASISIDDKGKLISALQGSSLADFFATIQLEESKADTCALSLFNDPIALPSVITEGSLIAAYPFPNLLEVKEIDGTILKKAMERSAEYFALDKDNNLIINENFSYPKVEHYNYDYYFGVSFIYDIKREIGDRVTELKLKDVDLLKNPEHKFTICINNYRASGTGGYNCYQAANTIRFIKDDFQELIIRYVEKQGNINKLIKQSFKVLN